jgi:RimJ/RimL family protein N-acetyltransferase
MYLQELDGDMFLRPMVEGDLEFMLDIRNEVRDLIHDNRIFTLDEAIEWYHTAQPENYVVAIHGDEVGIMRVRRGKQHAQSAEVGGDIHKEHRRRGYGVRAYNVLIPYLFGSPEVEELFLEVLEINMPAFNLYHKLGFEIHEFVPDMAKRPGRDLEGFVMNLTQEKWELNQ